MSLLNLASLILTPNAYKASKLYSIVPTNGNGDMTVVRATSATRDNSDGLVELVGNNIPRLEYDGSCPSILLEPQRTNSTANSTMVGASTSPSTFPTLWAVNAGGLTQTVVGVGTENGLSYIDVRFNGTATSTATSIRTQGITVVAAVKDEKWSSSAYLKIIAEPLPATNYRLNNIERNSVGGFLTTYNTMFTNTTLQRITTNFTVTDVLTAFLQVEILATVVVGQSYDFTIRIAAPQLEKGAYPTSYIPTTTTALTRNADLISRDNIYTNGLITAVGGTWFIELDNNLSLIRDSSVGIFLDSSVGFINGFVIRNTVSTSQRLSIQIWQSNILTNIYNTLTDKLKIAIKWNGTNANVYVNGVLRINNVSFTPTVMEFISASAQDVPKYIKSMMLFPTPLTDTECINLTTL
jgi:hypothetical protein